MLLLKLFAEYLYIGLFSVGGGLATLPFIYRLADKYPWLSAEQVGNIQAVAQSGPGAIGVNMAAQVGFYDGATAGLLPSITASFVAALGLITPSIIIIIIVARILLRFKESALVGNIFTGLRPAACGLLAAAGFGAIKLCLFAYSQATQWFTWFKWPEIIIFIAMCTLVRAFKWHPVVYIVIAGVVGIVLKL
ncbi:MAG: chromate transporter [Spirochaetaceae bacterium]|jgi:chromate transporter|nr:chromate transporter [Spirochaetaceae bacterium]